MHRILWIFATIFAISILAETATASEYKLNQVKEKWAAQYGYSHPFAAFERLAKSTRVSRSDLNNLKRQIDTVKTRNGYISYVRHCQAVPIPRHVLSQLKSKLGYNYFKRMVQFMEDTWNNNSRYMTYDLSETRMCVTGRF